MITTSTTGGSIPQRVHVFQSYCKFLDETVKTKGATIFRFRFRDLKVRLKLMILHNLFFLGLGLAVYVALTPHIEQMPPSAQRNLILALAAVYWLAVAALEFLILPRYVYGPLRRLLEADQATQAGDRSREYIDESEIPGDELGQIMRSRNATIRELHRHEEELIRKNEMLERQDRLASLGLLSAGVAHEFNTPLAVLQGSIEKLLETETAPRTRERLERMLRVTGRLRRISEGLVDFARARREEMGPVELRRVVEEAWALLGVDEKAAGVRFENGVQEGLLAHGNADRLLQVFVNLLRNALDAVSETGSIAVRSRLAGGGAAVVTVEDDGPGIPPEILPNIFEAFVTSRLDARGTGLGLTVAEGIVVHHGGSITASNRPQGGACIEVRLPRFQSCEVTKSPDAG